MRTLPYYCFSWERRGRRRRRRRNTTHRLPPRFSSKMFSPQFSLLAIMASSLALSALAQDSSSSSSTTASSADVTATTTTTSAPSINNAETTITALFGTATTGFVGSVVSANPCETTLAVVCDSEAPNPVDVCVLVPDVTVSFYFFLSFFWWKKWELESQPEKKNKAKKYSYLLPHPSLTLSSPPRQP